MLPFVRETASELLQSVIKLILKGFVKEILSDQLKPVGKRVHEGLSKKAAFIQLQVLLKLILKDLRNLFRPAEVFDQAFSQRVCEGTRLQCVCEGMLHKLGKVLSLMCPPPQLRLVRHAQTL